MFNDRFLRRILLRDSRAESSIVSLYKKLELQSAIGLLDTTMGDLSAAPSIVSLHDEMKEASRPKKKFLSADVRKMHDLLAKNMYKIRHRTMAYTNKYTLPDHSETREILIRRHASIRRSLRAQSFRELSGHNVSKSQKYFSLQPGTSLESGFELRRRSHAGGEARFQSGAPLRSSSRSLDTGKKLNTIKELGSPGESPVVSADSLAEYPSVTILDERASCTAKKAPVPVPRRCSSKPEEKENVDSEHLGRGREGEEPVRPPPLPPPGGWVPESREQGENEAGNPLLRHLSQGP